MKPKLAEFLEFARRKIVLGPEFKNSNSKFRSAKTEPAIRLHEIELLYQSTKRGFNCVRDCDQYSICQSNKFLKAFHDTYEMLQEERRLRKMEQEGFDRGR